MPQIPLHYVDLRTFCYATEDEKRVEEALRTFLPEGDDEPFEIERAESEGHYGDRILVLSARVENADDVRHVLSRLADLESFETLIDELDERVTENTEFSSDSTNRPPSTATSASAMGSPSVERSRPILPKEQALENAEEVLTRLRNEVIRIAVPVSRRARDPFSGRGGTDGQ